PWQRAEVDQQGLEGSRFEAARDGVARVGRMPVDQELRCEDTPAVLTHRHMDVRGSKDADQRVLDRLDRTKVVLAFRIAQETPVSLKILVESGGLATARMNVRPGMIDLPDLHERIPDRLTR